jgi:putative ABC transport system permease protein
VGVLTAIDSIQNSVVSNLANLGAESFDIIDKKQAKRNPWLEEPPKRVMDNQMANLFVRQYPNGKSVCISFTTGFGTSVLGNRRKTNPNAYIVGSSDSYLKTYGYTLQEGRNFNRFDVEQSRSVGIIGNEIKETLFPGTSCIGKKIIVAGKQVVIIGALKKIPSTMGNSGNARIILMPINYARIFKKTTGGYTIRVLSTKETLKNDQEIAKRLMRRIKADKYGKANSFVIEKNESAVSSLNSIGNSLKLGGGIIGFITILGASIGLLNIMIVSVKERTREIGVRKSLGATTNAIRLQFLMEAVMICLVGGFLGIFLGVLVGNIVPILTDTGGFVLPLDWIALGFVTSVSVGVLSGYLPANSAAKVDPVESLRYE